MESAIARITENSLDPRILPSQDIGLPFCRRGLLARKRSSRQPRRANQEQQGILVEKLRRNVERDKDNDAALTDLGWLVLHFWESDIKKIWTVV